jgi:hypothetical protein
LSKGLHSAFSLILRKQKSFYAAEDSQSLDSFDALALGLVTKAPMQTKARYAVKHAEIQLTTYGN